MSKFKTDKVVKLQGKEYVLFEGLLEVTHENFHLVGMESEIQQYPSSENGNVAIVKATVTVKDKDEIKTFVGTGDASPTSVNKMIAPHIIRMAETRAYGRAMRFLTGFGTVFEELGEVDFNDKKKKISSENTSKKPESKVESPNENKKTSSDASKAQLNKIEKDAKALGLSAQEVYVHLGIKPDAVGKSDASKAIKFLKTDEAKALKKQDTKDGENLSSDGEIKDDDLPF